MNVRFNFGTFLQELLSVIQFEIEIVIISIWTKPNLLDHCLLSLSFDFLLLLFLFVFEFRIIDNLTNWRVCFRRNLY